ncbi:unnamed protein product [Caenorhabditis auriculariae]|uniref:Protein CNPPD1 n=1 Tax=Caenorhabditis auriculariae TaxID=2777116 RepID=A0A8S1HAF4_9PELO|nr:unnamed protein product [Caenorhabditis auriculariae]
MPQHFSDFHRIRKRVKRSLGFGTRKPCNLSFPLSKLVVDFFDKKCPFDYMDLETSAAISDTGYADPVTLVVALIYLDRLSLRDKEYFESTNPTDLYLPALDLASKYIHDFPTYDSTHISDWADAVSMKNERLVELEWEFIKHLDWDVSIKEKDIEQGLTRLERWVTNDFIEKNDFCTYNELFHAFSSIPLAAYLSLAKQLFSFLGLTALVYTFSVFTMSSIAERLANSPSTSSESPVADVVVANLPICNVTPSSSTVILDYTLDLDENNSTTTNEQDSPAPRKDIFFVHDDDFTIEDADFSKISPMEKFPIHPFLGFIS